MSWRSWSISALPALGPDAKNTAGSPGSTRMRMKVMHTTPSRAGSDARSRRPTRRAMADPTVAAKAATPA